MLGSMYGLVGSYPDAYEGIATSSPVAYHALKGGILQMTRHLAVYWARDRIRVNAMSPGPFPAPTTPPAMVDRLCAHSPLRRMGQPYSSKAPLCFSPARPAAMSRGKISLSTVAGLPGKWLHVADHGSVPAGQVCAGTARTGRTCGLSSPA